METRDGVSRPGKAREGMVQMESAGLGCESKSERVPAVTAQGPQHLLSTTSSPYPLPLTSLSSPSSILLLRVWSHRGDKGENVPETLTSWWNRDEEGEGPGKVLRGNRWEKGEREEYERE